MNKYYLDTSIWLDYYEKRGENGERAKHFLLKIISRGDIVVYSDLILVEFKNIGYSQNEIGSIICIAKPANIKRVHITKEQIAEATKLLKQRGVQYRDTLHAILARDSESQLVSRDLDFEKLKDIAEAIKPENLI